MSENLDNPDKPNVYIHNSGGIHNNRFVIYTLILLAGFFIGFLSYAITPFGKSTITSSQVVNSTPKPTQTLNSTFPIDPSSSAVKSLWILYSLSGVVSGIDRVDIGNVSGFNIQISSPTGPLVEQTFFVSDQRIDPQSVVSMDKNGKETKLDLATLKKSDSVQISYQVDVKDPKQSQVTKLAILK